MKFILLFGPQAVGKMTVGQELERLMGLKLFHIKWNLKRMWMNASGAMSHRTGSNTNRPNGIGRIPPTPYGYTGHQSAEFCSPRNTQQTNTGITEYTDHKEAFVKDIVSKRVY